MGGFRYIAGGLIVIVAAFAVASSWPLLLSAFSPPAIAPAQPALAQSPAATQLPPTMAPTPLLTPNPAQAPASEPSITLTDLPDETPPHPGWIYVQQSAVLRVKPGGRGMPAPSLTNTELVIAKGTRLWPRKIEGGWVLVKSPGGRLGWLAVDEVGKHIPVCLQLR